VSGRMRRHATRRWWPILLALALPQFGCVTIPDKEPYRPPPITHYTVIPGDTLFGIAFRLDLDWRDLARWNDLDDPSLIYPGQKLVLSGPAGGTARVAASDTHGARQPARQSAGGGTASAGSRNARSSAPKPSGGGATAGATASVAAPAGAGRTWRWPGRGQVLAGYGDPGSVGRGIDLGGREGDTVVAAAGGRVVYSGSGLIGYGNLIIIKHDDTYLSAYGHNASLLVAQGQEVRAGERIALMGLGPGRKPLLHFEIRRNGQPVDPLAYLPARAGGR
jgi:lipoprotein NlpD